MTAVAEAAGLRDLSATVYRRLDAHREIYLDYAGGSLAAESQVEEHLRVLRDGVFGNPTVRARPLLSKCCLVEYY